MTPTTKKHLQTLNSTQEVAFINSLTIFQACAKRLAAKRSILGKNNIFTFFVEDLVAQTTDRSDTFVLSVKDKDVTYTMTAKMSWYGGVMMAAITVSTEDGVVFALGPRSFKEFLDDIKCHPDALIHNVYQIFLNASEPFEVKPAKAKTPSLNH